MHRIRYQYKGRLAFSSHDQIANLIIKNKAHKVLDIGCNQGFIGQSLRDKNWQGSIIGVDKNKEYRSVKKGNRYNRFINCDIENGFRKINQKFDAILFADVLEHLDNPLLALMKAQKKLKKSGKLYLSLPNVANLFIRLHLLFGNFIYLDYGILDKDHRWFFTFKSARKLIYQAGLKIIDNYYTPIPTPFLSRKKIFKMPLMVLYYFARLLSQIRKEVFAYQFIFVCRTK